MISLSKLAEQYFDEMKPKVSDFELRLNLSENYAKHLNKFLTESFSEVREFDCRDNGLVKSVMFTNEHGHDVSVEISNADSSGIRQASITESTDETVVFKSTKPFIKFTEFKNALADLSNDYKTETQKVD